MVYVKYFRWDSSRGAQSLIWLEIMIKIKYVITEYDYWIIW